MSTVNIVMATYNGDKYLKQQIESILGSTYTDWSLFIFDDGSTDDTIVIAKEYESKFPERIQVYQNEINLGVTLNFLAGLRKVYEQTCLKKKTDICSSIPYTSNCGEYFMFCDQDDVWNRDKITITLERMKFIEKKYGKEYAQLVFTDANVVDEKLDLIYHSFFRSQCLHPYFTDLGHLLMENKCIGCTVMVNRSVVKYLHQMPKSARYHDWWVALIASSLGHISYVGAATLRYRQHGKNVVGSIDFSGYVKQRLKSLQMQRISLYACVKQAAEFLEVYDEVLPERERKLIQEFTSLVNSNWLKKRYIILRYGFLKSGLIRNIGLLIIL